MKYEVRRYFTNRDGTAREESFLARIHDGWGYYKQVIGSLNYDGVALYLDGTKLASWGVVE